MFSQHWEYPKANQWQETQLQGLQLPTGVLAPSQVCGFHCCSWWGWEVSWNQTSVFLMPLLLGSWEMIPPIPSCRHPSSSWAFSLHWEVLGPQGKEKTDEDLWGALRHRSQTLNPTKGREIGWEVPAATRKGSGLTRAADCLQRVGWNIQGHSARSALTCGQRSKVTVVARLIYKLDWEHQEELNYDLCEFLSSCMSSFCISSPISFLLGVQVNWHLWVDTAVPFSCISFRSEVQ